MQLVDGIANRVAYLQRRRTIQRFHRLYYDSSWQTWRNTRWLNVNAYKTPLDLWIYQELIVSLEPQLVIETGTALGGSALFLATVCDAVGCGEIISIDSESRAGRPVHDRVTYLAGSSVAAETLAVVAERARGKTPILVILDSDHSREHVLAELRQYADFVTPGSYLVVEDTNLNGHPVVADFGPGPMEAVRDFLGERSDFEVDVEQEKFFMSFNPNGYLRRTSYRSQTSTVRPPRRRPEIQRPHGRSRRERGPRRVKRLAAASLLAALVVIGVPELLGDRPYDPRPSAWPELVEHV